MFPHSTNKDPSVSTFASTRVGRLQVELAIEQSDEGRAGVLARRTNRTRVARVYSRDVPIGRRSR
eukprot:3378680-Pyramimonas_sp.AAC.1